ncbi:hypothetical protein Mapa_014102 [Marchantia paleacea]|nr:hypothetical protein Mapa_014102 [Marchantia paleacea]
MDYPGRRTHRQLQEKYVLLTQSVKRECNLQRKLEQTPFTSSPLSLVYTSLLTQRDTCGYAKFGTKSNT